MSELSEKKSQDLATQIEIVKFYLHQIDWEYAALVVKKMREQASLQETLAVFKPAHPQSKNDLLRLQAEALNKFVEAVKLLRECDDLKSKIRRDESARDEMAQMFW